MKILCFIDSLGAGGAQRQMVGLVAMLKEENYDVKLIIYHDDMFFSSFLVTRNIDFKLVERCNLPIRRIRNVYRELKLLKPDLVISFLDTPNIISCLCRMFGLEFKLIVSERNTTQKLSLQERLKFFFFNWTDFIVPNSYSQELFIKMRYPNLSKRVVTITNFVDVDNFLPTTRSRKSIPVIMVAATIWPSKNTLGFIEAVKLLVNLNCVFKVYWYGKSSAYEDYFDLCNYEICKSGIQDVIQLLDKTEDILKAYKEADYFCLPSFFEGMPNVICEAMACGLPIICSDVCDNALYVHDGLNGFLFDPNSTESIANKIQEALNLGDSSYLEFSKRSVLYAERNFSKDSFLLEYVKLINRAC
jgi:glycosyltransferase involved in cell wall biosynthesis